jgi:hypothetical protein
MKAAFDTNVIGPLASPRDYPNHPDEATLSALRNRISSGGIEAFASESTFGLEALDRHVRIDDFLRSWASQSGKIKLPSPAPVREAILQEALSLGFKVLRVPRIALGPFLEIGEQAWAADVAFPREQRQSRTFAFAQIFAAQGPAALKSLGAELVTLHGINISSIPALPGLPPAADFFWLQGLVAEYDQPRKYPSTERFSRAVRDLMGEWADVDALASTHGYGINLFCTLDRAANSGTRGLLHPVNAPMLEKCFGITAVTPTELLARCA